ncbi:MAG: hypothetical protein ACI4D4_02785 [Lachnospira sp.]
MNKKNMLLILIGVFLVSLKFTVTFGAINIDIANDCIGFLLIVIGIIPMSGRNSLYKKSRLIGILGLAASIIGQVIDCIDWGAQASTFHSIAIGLTVIFAIYFTYYFTQALIMESKIQEKTAATRNYQMTWLILSAAVFVHFMAFGSAISLYSIIVETIVGVCAFYYCVSVYNTSKQLYED